MPRKPPRPYTVISVSMYDDDLAELNIAVAVARANGGTMNRSRMIREALDAYYSAELPRSSDVAEGKP